MFRTTSRTDQAKDAVATSAERVAESAQAAAERAAELKVKASEAASVTVRSRARSLVPSANHGSSSTRTRCAKRSARSRAPASMCP